MKDSKSDNSLTKVLVVEDEKAVLDLIVEILKLDGHEVYRAFDGHHGLQMIEETDFDVVITDFRMPQMTGLELFREAKKCKPGIEKRFVFISGEVDEHEQRSISRETGARFISKPFHIKEIQGTVDELLLGKTGN